ncbi:MAG: sensor histidine kinase [Bacteroidia bacterium]
MVTSAQHRLAITCTVVLFSTLLAYWSGLLWLSSDHPDLQGEWLPSGFISWLAGWLTLVASILLLGWLNYKFIYRRIQSSKFPHWWYLAWQIGLCWLLFEFLQWRTEHDSLLLPENMVVSLVLSALIYLMAYIADAFAAKRRHRALEQEKVAAELRALRNQLNPHFLFNALNTIYSETLSGNNQNSARLVHDLSGILRFALQQSQHDWVKASEEIDFLEKYIGLHRERLPQNVREMLKFTAETDHDYALPPLLLLPLVENAIQYGMHGVDARELSMRLTIEDAVLVFECVNTIYPDLQAQRKGTGQGINNVRQRLELLYPGRHKLRITNKNDEFRVLLKINLA